jgi:hypothetical protein
MPFLFPVRILKSLVKPFKRIYVPTKYWDGFTWRPIDESINYDDLEVISGDLYALKRNLSNLQEVIVDYQLDQVIVDPR